MVVIAVPFVLTLAWIAGTALTQGLPDTLVEWCGLGLSIVLTWAVIGIAARVAVGIISIGVRRRTRRSTTPS